MSVAPHPTCEQSTPAELAALASIEQRRAWQRGQRLPVEAYLQRFPSIATNADALLDLIYNETVLREELADQPLSRAEWIQRYPDLAEPLNRLFDVHELVATESSALDEACSSATGSGSDLMPPLENAPAAIGSYLLLEEIGRGGMGIVYRARHLETGKLVALKVILAGRFASPSQTERFHTEAEAIARLSHSGIAAVCDVGQAEDQYYLAMELVEGPSLADVLERGPLPPRRAAKILHDVARAVHYAHTQGVIHRDIKPQNILLDSSGRARVTDFGLAWQDDRQSRLTSTGQIVGTPQYMAPEQAMGRVDTVGPACDVYALGSTLYCALTGRPPFEGGTAIDVLRRIGSEEPQPPRRLNASVPRDAETICLKCLEKEPRRRYASALELANDLERFLADKPIVARPTGPVQRLARWCRRQPLLATLSAAILCLAGALVGGSLVSVYRLQIEQQATLVQLRRANAAESLANRRLLRALIAQTRSGRLSGVMGHRIESLRSLGEAVQLHAENPDEAVALTIRNELAACLSLTDVELPATQSVPRVAIAAADPVEPRFAYWDEAEREIAIAAFDSGSVEKRLACPGDQIKALEFAPDGSVLFASALKDGKPGMLVWDLARLSRRAAWIEVPHAIEDFDVAASGESIVAALAGGSVVLIDPVQGTWGEVEHSLGEAQGVRIRADGRQLAVWSGPVVSVVDASSGTILARLEHPPEAAIQCFDWSMDARLAAVGASDHKAYVWDMESGPRQSFVLEGHQSWVTAVRFHPQRDVLLTSARLERSTQLWDPWLGKRLVQFGGVGQQFSADGRRIFGASDSELVEWRFAGADVIRRFPMDPRLDNVGWGGTDREGKLLATGSWTSLALWDFRTMKLLDRRPLAGITSVAIAPDGAFVAAISEEGLERFPVVGSETGWIFAEADKVPPPPIADCLQHLAIARDGTLAVIGHGQALVHAAAGGTWLGKTMVHQGASQCAISPDGQFVATYGVDAAGLCIHHAASGKVLHTLVPEQREAIAAFSPDGKRLFGGAAGAYGFWNVADWTYSHGIAPKALEGPVTYATFSPDGALLATSDRHRRIKLFDVATGRELFHLPAEHWATWTAFSPDGSELICIDDIHGIRTWNLRRLREELALHQLDW